MKRCLLSITIFTVYAIAALTGCSDGAGESISPSGAPSAQQEVEALVEAQDEDLAWRIEIVRSELTKDISSTKGFVEYGGDINEVSYVDAPKHGCFFLLIEMSVNKAQVGPSKFDWKYLYVTDASGEQYLRHENDTFLQLHGLPRIKSTTLSIGTNDGFICFEVPESIDKGSLLLVCELEGSEQTLQLKPE